MKRVYLAAALAALSTGALAQAAAPAAAPAPRPTQPAACALCHKPAANNVAGTFDSVAFKSQSIQIDLGGMKEILRFDPKQLKVIDAGDAKPVEHLREIRRGHETRFEYVVKDGEKWAAVAHVKGPIRTPPAKLANFEQVAAIVAEGEQAKTVLIDSRPLTRFQEGSIPGAINLPYAAWDRFVGRLPPDKNTPIVFFCQGPTCMKSPLSLRKAEALGYTDVKVYREGVPEWMTRDFLVTAPEFVKAAYFDREIPVVLIDARSRDEAASGRLTGAVAIAPAQLPAALKMFPDPKLRAPIVVYDGRGHADAVTVARALIKAGQTNVQVMQGGLLGWQRAGFKIESGSPAATQITYVPRPRPGSVPVEEFRKLVAATPADVVILDVRNTDEANAGMLKGALLIPDEELTARMQELPKGKRIVLHCASGVRAEMAFHKLREAGFKAGFLNADIEIARDGSFKLTPR